jgi:hypothetical protein
MAEREVHHQHAFAPSAHFEIVDTDYSECKCTQGVVTQLNKKHKNFTSNAF